jgi:hypothetical protein
MMSRYSSVLSRMLPCLALLVGLRGCCPDREVHVEFEDGSYVEVEPGPESLEDLTLVAGGDVLVITYETAAGVVEVAYEVTDRHQEVAEDDE